MENQASILNAIPMKKVFLLFCLNHVIGEIARKRKTFVENLKGPKWFHQKENEKKKLLTYLVQKQLNGTREKSGRNQDGGDTNHNDRPHGYKTKIEVICKKKKKINR